MKSFLKNLPPLAGSIVINVSVLASLYFIHLSLPAFAKEMTLESIFTWEMPQEEITREVELNIQHELFPLDVDGFRTAALAQVIKAARAMQLVEQAIALLEKVKPLRASEANQRWRSGYDLALAQ